MKPIWLLILATLCAGAVSDAAPAGDAVLDAGMVNPGHHEQPDWFKASFLDIREDVAEAAEAGKRVILYFYQDGCPYCAKLLRENFGDRATVELAQRHFDVVAINLWGDREVTGFLGEPTTEKSFAAGLKVQFTPTMLLLDEQGRVLLRVNGYYPPHKFRTALRYVAERRDRGGERFQDFYLSLDPKAASGKLHEEGGFLTAPFRFAETGRPLVVMFEQPSCPECDELHGDILRREPVAYALSNLEAAVVNAWSTDPVQTPDGRKLTVREWAKELGIEYTPSLVFFDAGGTEVFRTEGYLRSFHIHGALDYVSTGAYLRQPNFQRYLQERRAALEARGFEVDLMD
jgi:thioredoxin-related protein